jgi:ribosome-binding protein aMBF1 (putative translation factor)
MIRVTKIRQPRSLFNTPKWCEGCGRIADLRLSVVRIDAGVLRSLDLCYHCIQSAMKQFDVRERKRSLKKILG